MLESAERFPINPFIASYVAYRESQRRSEWPTVAASAVVDSFADAIDSADGPFFGWTHFMDLHAPIHPDRVLEGGLVDAPVAKQFVWDAHRVVGREEPNYDRMYDSVLRYVDAQIGRLVELLRQRGLWDDTVLIVTSDHGEALYDRGVHGHGEGTGEFDHVDDVLRHYLYDELLHVPLLIRTPEGGAERINEPVSLCGLGELIAEIVDASAPDLSARNGRPVVADALTEDGHTIAVRSEDWKLITPCVADDAAPETWSNELFRVASDRGERAPIDEPHIESQLAEAAAEIVTDPSDLPQMRGTVSEDTREQLAELGYR
jgi:arylsulfatase A-like enzyme